MFLLLLCTGCEDLLDGISDGDPRYRLTGGWKVDETNSYAKSGLEVYRVDITMHPTDSSRVRIYNFLNISKQAYAEAILSGMRLTLPEQSLTGGFTFSGRGDVKEDWTRITWSYIVDDGSGVPANVSAVYTRLD